MTYKVFMAKAKPKPAQSAPSRKPIPAKKPVTPGWLTFLQHNWMPMLLIAAYAVVDFLPPFDSVDAMGAQWLYLVLVSFITTVFILWNNNQNYLAGINQVGRSIMTLLYLALFLLAGISIISALNKTEAFVVYGRFIATFVTYINIAILLYNRPELMKFFAHILALMLLFRSIQILISFSNGFGEIPLETLIYSQGRESGNKNIMAATFTVRLPFVLYCIYSSKLFGKIFYGVVLMLGILVIFFLNARTTYVAVLLQTFLYLVFLGMIFFKEKGDDILPRLKRMAARASFWVIPLLIAFVIGQLALRNAVEMETKPVAYGTVTARLSSIKLTGETSNNRDNFWRYAINYAAKHPLMGCGIGNWKLASIPYEKDISYELWVAYHCHNDFLEISAEVGIAGGLLLLGIYFCALFYTIKTWMSEAEKNIKVLSIISLIALAGYFTDAFFNFPNERPVMQFYFVFILGINLTTYLISRKKKAENSANPTTVKSIYGFSAFLFLLPALYVTYMTYSSMVIQARVNPDISIEVPHYTSDEAKKLPAIPNLNVFAYPIDAIKARYLLNEKKTDEALFYLNKSINVNPYISYNEFLKGAIYVELQKWDSAYYYSKKGFMLKPGAKSNYLMFNYVALKTGDTAMVHYAFVEHNKRKPSAWVWDNYLRTMLQLQRANPTLLATADTALKLYPGDADLLRERNIIVNNSNVVNQENKTIPPQQVNDAAKYSQAGIDAFKNKDYQSAIRNFKKAYELNNMDYVSIENEGMSYYSLQKWNDAIYCYEKVIASKTILTGKSEFFKGICLVTLGKKDQGCVFMKISLEKKYPDAQKFIDTYCK